jgi:cytochrome c oxidase subunit IV
MSNAEEPHVASLQTYFTVFFALMALTVVTVVVSFFDLGVFNIVGAITIAAVKAYVVVLYFMHLKDSNRIIWLTAAAGFIWFVLMIALTIADYASRSWIPPPEAW